MNDLTFTKEEYEIASRRLDRKGVRHSPSQPMGDDKVTLVFHTKKDEEKGRIALNIPPEELLTKLDLTKETYKFLYDGFYTVWNYVADDLFNAIGSRRVSRKEVVEMVFDANRFETARHRRLGTQEWVKNGYHKFIAHYGKPDFETLMRYVHPEGFAYND